MSTPIPLHPLPAHWQTMTKGRLAKARIPEGIEFDCALPQGLVNIWHSRGPEGADALVRHSVVTYPPGDFIGEILDF